MRKKKGLDKVDMQQMFMDLQSTMISKLKTFRKNIKHPVDKGDGSEAIWIKFFSQYLPKRYSVAKATIIDHLGNTSQQIDVVIYDSQYTPFIFNEEGTVYIPAESVYAVFEAKQEITKGLVSYAGEKISSVRRLQKTSAPIIDKGTIRPAAQVFTTLGGFLCLENGWKDSIKENNHFEKIVQKSSAEELINIGCVLNDRSFVTKVDKKDELNPSINIHYSTKGESLIFFFLKLVSELQKLGTVRAIDLNKYIDQLKSQ
ncbi:MAG: DUF6602 domain-containing protein [Chitinophagaceae bacterium]